MSIITSGNPEQTVKDIQQDVKAELPSSNPWLESGLLRAICVGLGRMSHSGNEAIERAVELFFPFKTIRRFIQYWATLKNMSPLDASKATGPVTFPGVAGTEVTQGYLLKIGTTEYEVLNTVDVAENERNVLFISVVGGVAIIQTTEEHNLADGMSFVLAGSNQSDWNKSFSNVIVLSDVQIQVNAVGLTTPVTGDMTITFDAALGTVRSVETGAYNNQVSGTELTFSEMHTGLDNVAGVQYGGITGGSDDETDDEFSARVIYRWQNPETPFNPAKIKSLIKSLDAKNTRVWVRRVTPEVGAVSIFFVRDNDESIIPSASEVAIVKAALMEIVSPQTEEDDVHVNDPLTGVSVDTIISNVVPNTTTMKNSLRGKIRTFFRGNGLNGGVGENENLDLDRYKSELLQTVDFQTGEKIQSFVMSQPSATTQIDANEIAVEGQTTVG